MNYSTADKTGEAWLALCLLGGTVYVPYTLEEGS